MNGTMLHEKLMTLAEAARTLPGRPHAGTLARWRARGVRNVKLEAMRIGGIWYTSLEALARFCNAVTTAASSIDNMPMASAPSGGTAPTPESGVDDALDAHGL